MSELTVVRFVSRCDSDPYRCSLPNDQSGEYYRKSEVDAELERLRADAEILNFLAERQWHMPDFSDDARCYRVTVWADGYWLTSEKATFRDAVNDLMRKVREG